MIKITYNSITNDDIGVVVENINIQLPSKTKIKETVPFMHGTYDFSTIGTGGEPVYGERNIIINFNFIERSREALYVKYSKVMEWLDIGRNKLIFSHIPDYYFIAEVENAPEFEEVIRRAGKLKIEFVCQPFKIGVNLEGSDIWDTFNFEIDVAQDTQFDVTDTKTVNIINVGRNACPTINTNSNMSIVYNSKIYNLSIGDNKFYDLKLISGNNSIVINGIGKIKFIFRKEVL